MSSRSSLTVTSGTTITSAWGNGIRDHIVPKTTTDDVSSTGQLAANTSTKRLVIHDGSSAVRLAHYTAAGRTGAVGSISLSSSSGTVYQINPTVSSDPDGFYTGLSGGAYKFTIPSGLGGLYAIYARTSTSSPVTGGIQLAAVMSTTEVMNADVGTNNSHVHIAGMVPLAAGDTISFQGSFTHSGSLTVLGSFYIYRMAL